MRNSTGGSDKAVGLTDVVARQSQQKGKRLSSTGKCQAL
jgi:hypothetical protein